MTCNHVANIFALQMPGWLTVALCSLGGLTFPIMAFLLDEGYRHTSNIRKYAKRLAIFALVAQVPYSLLWGATANVLITLLLGLGVLWADDHLGRGHFALVFGGALVVSVWCDWGVIGPLMIYLFHRLREEGVRKAIGLTMLMAALALAPPAIGDLTSAINHGGAPEQGDATRELVTETPDNVAALEVDSPWEVLAETPSTLAPAGSEPLYSVMDAGAIVGNLGALGYATIGFGLAAVLLMQYRGRRGRPLKWFFYCYYPAHLMLLWAVAQVVFSP